MMKYVSLVFVFITSSCASFDPYVCMKRENGNIIYTNLSLPSHTRLGLLCPNINEDNVKCTTGRNNQICSCLTKPMWEDSSLKELTIEYINRKGGSRILYDVPGLDRDLYQVSETNSFLTLFPSNLCSFPNIVKINFAHNQIRKLEDIGCIHRLYSLDLSYNRITSLSASLFRGLSFLSNVDFSNNAIHSIEPGSFNDETLGLINLDVSHNSILVLDFSNFVLPKAFCRISYAYNKIQDFSNKAANPITETDNLGDVGYLDFSYNHVQRVPNFKFLNRFMLNINRNPISCDCFLEEYLWQVGNTRDTLAINGVFQDYTCNSPLSLRGTSIVDLIHNNDFDILVCQLHHCHEGCSCFFQSSKYTIIVNCTKMDTELPNFTKMIENVKTHSKMYDSTIKLHVSGRLMETFHARDYLAGTSNNDLLKNYNFLFFAVGLASSVILISIVYCVYQRYKEYIVVFHKWVLKIKENHDFKYDVYISIDEDNEQALRYVRRSFIPMLQTLRLKTFLLVRDSDIGGVTEECVIETINDSRKFVLFLTSSLSLENGSVFAIEWRHAWNRYKSAIFYDIVLINFDLLRLSDIKDQRIKAISAVGHSVHFSDIAFSEKVKRFLKKREKSGGNLEYLWSRGKILENNI